MELVHGAAIYEQDNFSMNNINNISSEEFLNLVLGPQRQDDQVRDGRLTVSEAEDVVCYISFCMPLRYYQNIRVVNDNVETRHRIFYREYQIDCCFYLLFI